MKKIKFVATAVIAAALLFTGCTQPNTPEKQQTSEQETQKTDDNGNQAENQGGENNQAENQGGENNQGGDETTDENKYNAPEIDSYFKYYFVSSPKADTNKAIADWSSGSTATANEDGTYSIATAELWGGNSGICAAITGLEAGSLANYEYIVFTVDSTDFEFDEGGAGNKGVNIKVPEIQEDISDNYVANGNKRTYYAPLSLFGDAPQNATEFALIIGGTGNLKIEEIYIAAKEDPLNKAVTSISISPTTANVEQNATVQFTVKDSNYNNITETVNYTLSGAAAADSSISSAGLLTAGSTEGTITVTAKYTVEGNEFTSPATVTVLPAMVNLVKAITLEKYTSSDFNGDAALLEPDGTTVIIEGDKVTLHKAEDSAWNEWSCQLFLKVTGQGEKIFEAGKKYFVSVTVNSSAALQGCVWKEDMKASILQQGIVYEAGLAKTLTAEVNGADQEYFKCLLSFPGQASDITVSNIKVYEITE